MTNIVSSFVVSLGFGQRLWYVTHLCQQSVGRATYDQPPDEIRFDPLLGGRLKTSKPRGQSGPHSSVSSNATSTADMAAALLERVVPSLINSLAALRTLSQRSSSTFEPSSPQSPHVPQLTRGVLDPMTATHQHLHHLAHLAPLAQHVQRNWSNHSLRLWLCPARSFRPAPPTHLVRQYTMSLIISLTFFSVPR